MKKILFIGLCSLGWVFSETALAQDLLQVVEQALKSDPAFQAQVAQVQANKEGVPIARSYLLPQLAVAGNAEHDNLNSRAGTTIQNVFVNNGQSTTFGVGKFNYNFQQYQVSLNQSVFNYALWAGLKQAKYISKAASATYNAALQNLMSRTSQTYFNVLAAEDNLRYVEAEKKAVHQQLDQAQQQYKVGVIAITSVYQAQAQYDSLLSQEIAAQNNVINQRENLRAITGVYYDKLWGLKNKLPLINPAPQNVDDWVRTAVAQNWTLIAQRLNADAAQANVSIQRAGNLPVVTAYGSNTGTWQTEAQSRAVNQTDNAVGVQVNLPIFQGGLVMAETKQAGYQYQNARAQAEQAYRTVVDNTHTSYNNVVAGISQVKADKQSVLSNASSLRSTIEGYKVGTQTMLDVLEAQQKLYDAERQFSHDEYAYLNATIALKEAAGTLSLDDLNVINSWLSERKESYSTLNINSIQQQAEKNYNATLKANAALGIDVSGGDILQEVNKLSHSKNPIDNDPLPRGMSN